MRPVAVTLQRQNSPLTCRTKDGSCTTDASSYCNPAEAKQYKKTNSIPPELIETVFEACKNRLARFPPIRPTSPPCPLPTHSPLPPTPTGGSVPVRLLRCRSTPQLPPTLLHWPPQLILPPHFRPPTPTGGSVPVRLLRCRSTRLSALRELHTWRGRGEGRAGRGGGVHQVWGMCE